jgi:hypothetical protein
METIFTLPLAAMAFVLVLVALLLLSPKALSLPLSQQISKARKAVAVQVT